MKLRQFCRSLADFPERGLTRADIWPGLRVVFLERRVTIAYSIEDSVVVVARVFHGGQDWEAELRSDLPDAEEDSL